MVLGLGGRFFEESSSPGPDPDLDGGSCGGKTVR